ncbi:SAGA-associated factor 73-like [Leptopilina heterotoma]|uniref:SAGA-associated factor 73-like n=1 Tax=Leptopilina heterotoma TaxID=63436 RepID=UPI001CA8D512|nr:SAGA-associated factor 73-like [Leptopilina heterotoma]
MDFLKPYIAHRETDSSCKLVRTKNNDNDAVDTDTSDDDDDGNDYDAIEDDNGDYDDTDLKNRSNVLLNQDKNHKFPNAADYHNSGPIDGDTVREKENETLIAETRTKDYLAMIKDLWDQVPKLKRRRCFENIMNIIYEKKKK